jgi:hypothetical protein
LHIVRSLSKTIYHLMRLFYLMLREFLIKGGICEV